MNHVFWLSDEQFALIQSHLTYCTAGWRREDDRRIINGIIHVLQSGCRWQDCPSEYGPSTTVYNRYNRWSQKGIWQYLFAVLTVALSGTPEKISLDASHVKVHRCAGGGNRPLMTGCGHATSASKKTAHASEQEHADVQAVRVVWRKRQAWLLAHMEAISKIAFIDETEINTKMARLRGTVGETSEWSPAFPMVIGRA